MARKIIYTITDEAPALATQSLLPIVRAFAAAADLDLEAWDISLAGRILAAFPDHLRQEQRREDALAALANLVKRPEATIIKLPNISASLPQLRAAIAELQQKGYAIPDYPESPQSDEEREIRGRYDAIKGSAVNPVLRQGNSDRRAPAAVKQYARSNPHSMGAWSAQSGSHVAAMSEGDFYGSERSLSLADDTRVRIEFIDHDNGITVLKDDLCLQSGDIIDTAVMRAAALRAFIRREIADARCRDLLFSVHLKATMMKVSDPIIFGHFVEIFFEELYRERRGLFAGLGVDPRNGLGDLLAKTAQLSAQQRREIAAAIENCYARSGALAMVDSERGISNLHAPNDIIVDASMPAAIRSSGKMWGPDGTLADAKFCIPDRCYAAIYQEVIDFCKRNGAFDPRTMGTVANIGLMAQKAEEYGSHDTTFEASGEGVIRVVESCGRPLVEQAVAAGDIFRLCRTADLPVRDWVRLAVERAALTGVPTIFWLDEQRAHDAELIKKVGGYLHESGGEGLDIQVMSPRRAMAQTLERLKEGEDSIAVTGNVLRDYLTDLFPILELGTSAKMLSIVPLMGGGGLFETGAGGSAPKHVQQFEAENHLRWDSLGEFLALAAAFDHIAQSSDNAAASALACSLDAATSRLLQEQRSPSYRVGELDSRGSHFYLALYWAEELAKLNTPMAATFTTLAKELVAKSETILRELGEVQGSAIDIGGYYAPAAALARAAMRPSATFNAIIDAVIPN